MCVNWMYFSMALKKILAQKLLRNISYKIVFCFQINAYIIKTKWTNFLHTTKKPWNILSNRKKTLMMNKKKIRSHLTLKTVICLMSRKIYDQKNIYKSAKKKCNSFCIISHFARKIDTLRQDCYQIACMSFYEPTM